MHAGRLVSPVSVYNYDIALVKVDRLVMFSTDIAPICLEGLVHSHTQDQAQSQRVFISGFGLTLYRDKEGGKRTPECSTNSFLPRPYHACKV